MEYAIVEINKKQYKVTSGAVLEADKLPNSENSNISFDKVLLHVKESEVVVGTPYIEGMIVKAQVLGVVKGDKLRVSRFKAKSRYRKTIGFRPVFSKIQIKAILKASASPKKEQPKRKS